MDQHSEGIDCVLLRQCVYESEQWTYIDRGHTTLTVDTQEYTEWTSTAKALTACYLRQCVYESEQWTGTDCGHTPLTVDTQEWASRVKALTAC